MTECRSPELQDLLPDFAAELLDDALTAQVHTHLGECAACAEDVALLRVARRIRPSAAAVDVARIVAALPAPPQVHEASVSGPRLVREVIGAAHSVPTKRPNAVLGQSVWRVAAMLGVVIAGATSIVIARQGLIGVTPTTTAERLTPSPESVALIAAAPTAVAGESLGVAASRAPVAASAVSVSYGDLGDYTEDELQRMLDRLNQWDGATSTEPPHSTPIDSPRGGSL